MDCASGDKEMIMLPSRKLVHVLCCPKLRSTVLCQAQVADHCFGVDTRLQTEIYASVRASIEQIVTLVLRVVHSEFAANVLCLWVHLEREVASTHRVEEVETDRELRSESGIDFLTEQFTWVEKHKIDGRDLNTSLSEPEKQTILFRNTIKTPCVIRHVFWKIAYFFHPMSSPRARIKVRNYAERVVSDFMQSIAQGAPGYQLGYVAVRINQKIDFRQKLLLQLIGSTPISHA